MDAHCFPRYAEIMLDGIKIFSADTVWRAILADMGAVVTATPATADVNIDELEITQPTSPMALKAAILRAIDSGDVMRRLFGRDVSLPRLQGQIVMLLHKNGAMSVAAIKNALGYSPGASTHVVDNAIYQLRRAFGHDFIINENGTYRIGRL